MHHVHRVRLEEPAELGRECREAACLDLDEERSANDVDLAAVDGHFEAIAGKRDHVLQRGVERTFVFDGDRVSRALSIAGAVVGRVCAVCRRQARRLATGKAANSK